MVRNHPHESVAFVLTDAWIARLQIRLLKATCHKMRDERLSDHDVIN